jgi:hypothetical protein
MTSQDAPALLRTSHCIVTLHLQYELFTLPICVHYGIGVIGVVRFGAIGLGTCIAAVLSAFAAVNFPLDLVSRRSTSCVTHRLYVVRCKHLYVTPFYGLI